MMRWLVVAAVSLAVLLLLWSDHLMDVRFVAGGRLGATRVLASDANGDAFPKVLVDPIGREIRLARPPRRIVSAVLSGDEMLAGLTDTERVLGVTYLADDAGISGVAGHYPGSTARNHGKIEELLALEPDLVVVEGYSDAATVRLLLRGGIAVVRFVDSNGFAAIEQNILTLGAAIGEGGRAAALVQDMRDRIDAVGERVRGRVRPRVLYLTPDGSTVGPGSLIDEMIELAGGYNVTRDTGLHEYGRLSTELAIALQPDVLLLSGWQTVAGASAWPPLDDPIWQRVPAVVSGQVHRVHGAWLSSVSQTSVRGVEVIASLLHPAAFAGTGPSP